MINQANLISLIRKELWSNNRLLSLKLQGLTRIYTSFFCSNNKS